MTLLASVQNSRFSLLLAWQPETVGVQVSLGNGELLIVGIRVLNNGIGMCNGIGNTII